MSISSTSEEDSGDSNMEKEAELMESKQSTTESVSVDAADLPKDIQDENPAEEKDENDDQSVTTKEPKKKKGLS
eukprot:scaffold87102_cov20-Attheya_sp.AAC.1